MEESTELTKFIYGADGLHDSVATRASELSLSRASRNLIPDGAGLMRPVKGLDVLGTGARLMFPAGGRWVGLDDVGGQAAAGTAFSWIAEMLLICGFGQLVFDGAIVPGVFASSLLKILLRWGGSYTHANSGPFVAGTPQPSAPTVGVIESSIGGVPTMDGTYSFKIAWIKVTGGRSIASPTSINLVVKGKCVYLVVPQPPVGGETLVVFTTKKDLGGRGLHYRLVRANPYSGIEYAVEDIERSIADLQVTNGSNIVISPALAAFAQADVGKRFAPVSAGFTVPAGTTITSVDSATQIKLSGNVTVTSGANPRTAKLISYAGGFDRGVLLNWRESDLADETAWIEDYPPPPASHCFPLDKVIGLITDSDSLNSASGENRGTVAHFSMRNLPESFSPLHRLFIPEKVVALIWRATDAYVFVGCENWIGAFMFIDALTEAPATLTTILADEGILSPNNWCIRQDGLYLITAKGSLVRIIQGGAVDIVFGDKVRRIISGWTEREKIVVASYPDGVSVSVSYKNQTLLFNTQTGNWSALIYLADFAPNIEVLSGLAVGGRLLLTGIDKNDPDGARTLYDFDKGDGSVISAIPHYQQPASKHTKNIDQLTLEYHADRTDKPVYLSLHINDQATYCDDAEMTSGSNIFVSNKLNFTAKDKGKYVLVVGAGNTILRGRIIQVTSAHSVRLGTCTRRINSSVALNASNSVTNGYAVIAHRIYEFTPEQKGENRPRPIGIGINGVRSFAVGVTMETAGEDAMPLNTIVGGTVNPETTWK